MIWQHPVSGSFLTFSFPGLHHLPRPLPLLLIKLFFSDDCAANSFYLFISVCLPAWFRGRRDILLFTRNWCTSSPRISNMPSHSFLHIPGPTLTGSGSRLQLPSMFCTGAVSNVYRSYSSIRLARLESTGPQLHPHIAKRPCTLFIPASMMTRATALHQAMSREPATALHLMSYTGVVSTAPRVSSSICFI